MPIYEYRCADCGHTFEEIQQFSDPDPEQCPSCHGEEISRLVSRSNFQLKGGGWYADDYESTSGSVGEETSGGSDSSGKSDSSAQSGTTSSDNDAGGGTGGGDQAAAE